MLSLRSASSAGPSPDAVTRAAECVDPGPRSTATAWRRRRRSASKQTLVAMWYSHVLRLVPSSNRSRARHARIMVSWTASSASVDEPSIRRQWRANAARWRSSSPASASAAWPDGSVVIMVTIAEPTVPRLSDR